MLPLVPTVDAIPALDVVDAIAAADIRVAIEVVIHVDVDVTAAPAATPTPAAAPRSAHGPTNTERDRTRSDDCARRWRIVDRRIGIRRRAINNSRIVGRHVNHFRVCLLDHNHLLAFDRLHLDFLLLV